MTRYQARHLPTSYHKVENLDRNGSSMNVVTVLRTSLARYFSGIAVSSNMAVAKGPPAMKNSRHMGWLFFFGPHLKHLRT
jgi:hypothetical protein